jgi:hypothetical protein
MQLLAAPVENGEWRVSETERLHLVEYGSLKPLSREVVNDCLRGGLTRVTVICKLHV